MRTNLLQRLMPDVKDGFNINRPKYSDSVERIEKFLSDKVFYHELTVEQVKSIFTFSDLESHKRSSWNWRFGEDIFETEKDVC